MDIPSYIKLKILDIIVKNIMIKTTDPTWTFDEEYNDLIDKYPIDVTRPAKDRAKCASWRPSVSIGRKMLLTSGETIVTMPAIKNKEDTKKSRILNTIIKHQA